MVIKDLSYSFRSYTGEKKVLDKINISIGNGIYGLIGPNGAGKTTLLRCISGLYDNYAGVIDLENGKKIKGIIGYLPQNFVALRGVRVIDVLKYFAALKGIDKNNVDKEIERCAGSTNITDYMEYKTEHLSGGMMKRLGIAISILGDVKILLLDEPTSGLDVEERRSFLSVLKEIAADRTIIISTHILSDIQGICNGIILLNKGHVIFNGTEKDMLDNVSDGNNLESAYCKILAQSRLG